MIIMPRKLYFVWIYQFGHISHYFNCNCQWESQSHSKIPFSQNDTHILYKRCIVALCYAIQPNENAENRKRELNLGESIKCIKLCLSALSVGVSECRFLFSVFSSLPKKSPQQSYFNTATKLQLDLNKCCIAYSQV